MGMGGSLKPKLLKESKKSKIYGFSVPKLGRFAFSRDNGEASLFFREMLSTNLRAIHRAPNRSIRGAMRPGEILGEYDLGSGKVTNIGVTSLANDSNWKANTTENLATLNLQKFMLWGTGKAGAAEPYNWKLETQSEVEGGTKKEALAVSTSVLSYLSGGNSKIIITGTLEEPAVGPVEIVEWGLFSAAKTEGTAKTANTSTTAIALKDTVEFAAPGNVASAKDVRGAQGYIVAVPAAETEIAYGLVTSNTKTEAVIPAWVKGGSAATAATPATGTAKYGFYPIMFDRRVFAGINVEKGNKVEFPYELTINSGG
jgi:hypothetical protein